MFSFLASFLLMASALLGGVVHGGPRMCVCLGTPQDPVSVSFSGFGLSKGFVGCSRDR